MKNCKSCMFFKRSLINDYIKDADIYKCDMDGDMILDPYKEGENCTWFKGKRYDKESIVSKIRRYCFGKNE